MNYLKNKTILFLAPKFFDYEFEIKKELENFGAKVIYFDERPKNDFFTKVFIRLNLKFFIYRRIENYYKNIIEITKNESIDYLFLVTPETINIEKIKKIKNMHKNLRIYTYMWDSIENKKNAFPLIFISDKFFTFDSNDININEKIKFLPLFYIKDYENVTNTKNNLVYDIVFIGTIHSDRYKIVKEIEKQLKELKLNSFFYFYSPSKILFFLQKLFKKDFRNIKWMEVSFNPLNKSYVIDIIKKSKCVIDIEHPLQTGLTMRTLEIIGAKKKLLTTNNEVTKYDFYNKNNIFIIDRNKIELPHNFLLNRYIEIDKNIYEKYSLKNWIKTIFESENSYSLNFDVQKIQNYNIALVLVTFNRSALLIEMLESVVKQTILPNIIYVIDNNSSDNTAQVVNDFIKENKEIIKISYHNTGANLGGAGGFEHGCRLAFNEGYEWIWLADDDVELDYACLENLLKYKEKADILQPMRVNMDGSYAEISGIDYEINSLTRLNPKKHRVKDMKHFTWETISLKTIPFEGPLIHRRVFEKVGFPDPRFFIFYDDLDFALRAQRADFSILCVRKAIMKRKIPFIQSRALRTWKGYFMYRNFFYVQLMYGKKAIAYARVLTIFMLVLIYSFITGKMKSLPMLIDALKDSIKKDFSKNDKYRP